MQNVHWNWPDAETAWQGRRRRMPGRATWLVADVDGEDKPKAIAIRYHGTRVITWLPNWTIVLNSGGWRTSTTKARMNAYLPDGYRVWQDRGVWKIYHMGHFDCVFKDGIRLTASRWYGE